MRVLFAAFVGGIALFVWGFVSWTVLDWHRSSGGVLPGETAVVETLRSTNTRTGVYTVPGIDHKADVSDAEKEKAKSQLSTWAFEQARHRCLAFIGADARTDTCVFVKNTTEAINKLARRMASAPEMWS